MNQIIITGLLFSIIGYFLGSILFAQLFTEKIKHINIESVSADGNPGTANAFKDAGFLCGALTLLCDLGKGTLPVYCYIHSMSEQEGCIGPISFMLVPVMLTPVLGHAYSVFHHFQGGKCIAVSFGVLIGLLPYMPQPLLILAIIYIVLALLRIKPNDKCTMLAFPLASMVSLFLLREKAVVIVMVGITMIVLHKQLVFKRSSQMASHEIRPEASSHK